MTAALQVEIFRNLIGTNFILDHVPFFGAFNLHSSRSMNKVAEKLYAFHEYILFKTTVLAVNFPKEVIS